MKHERPWEIFSRTPKKNGTSTLTHVSLFSGCGGFDLGFREAGFKTIFANDINEDACRTFERNLGEIANDDITTMEIPVFSKRPDVLTAGFPCQPFSNAGSRKGTGDHRGSLFETALDVVAKCRPRSIVFENVRGLLSSKSDNKLLIQEICERLDQLKYDVAFSLIDASLHHVPQKRLRLFIVGIEKIDSGTFVFPEPLERDDLSLEHTIFDIGANTPNQNEIVQLNPQAIKIGAMVPEGGSWKSIPYEQLPDRLRKIKDNIARYRWPNFYRKYARTEIAGTITAAFKPENAGVWHPAKPRPYTVREIARIQSFPDWFRFEGRTVKSKYQQIGNAVPPRLAYEMAVQIIKTLSQNDKTSSPNRFTFDDFVSAGKPLRASDTEVVYVGGSSKAVTS